MTLRSMNEKVYGRPEHPVLLPVARECHAVICIDWEGGDHIFENRWDNESGVPEREYTGHVSSFVLPLNTDLQALYDQIFTAPYLELIERVRDGYASEFDGHNDVARFNKDAQEAFDELIELLTIEGVKNEWINAEYGPNLITVHFLPAHDFQILDGDDWVRSDVDVSDDCRMIRFKSDSKLVIHKDNDDTHLIKMAERLEAEALENNQVLIQGTVLETLHRLRNEL